MPVWNSGLTKGQVKDIEKIQKVGLRIILRSEYKDYDSACQSLNIEPLIERRLEICTKFALKLYKVENAQQIYNFPSKSSSTRSQNPVVILRSNTARNYNAPHNYLSRLINDNTS